MPAKKITRSQRICRALKAAQINKGYTQADIAKRLGVNRSTISRWYNCPDEMSVGKFRLLCAVLAIEPADILAIE